MSDYVRLALPALFVACWGVAAIAWLVAVVSMVQLPFNAKPNSLTGWLRLNPFNVMLYTDKLTPRGLAIRRRVFLAAAVFALSIATGLATFMIAKTIAPDLLP